MAWLFDELSHDAKKKVYSSISNMDEVPEGVIAQINYYPEPYKRESVWLLVEPLIDANGVGWDSRQLYIPVGDAEEPPYYLQKLPFMELSWMDLSEDLRRYILHIRALP